MNKKNTVKTARKMQKKSAYKTYNKSTKWGVCDCCGKRKPVEMHHAVPRCAGGDDSTGNLVPLCFKCHVEAHQAMPDWSWRVFGRKGGIVTAKNPANYKRNLWQFVRPMMKSHAPISVETYRAMHKRILRTIKPVVVLG